MKKLRIVSLLLALAMCAALCACGGGSTSTGSGSGEGIGSTDSEGANSNSITVGIAQDLDDSLDPHRIVKAGTREILFNVFEGLVKPTPEGELVPAVAEDYQVSEDGTQYTFTLREGIKFHNGQAVTVDDVIASIERCADDSEGTPLVPAFSVIQSVEATDDRTVVITIDQRNNEFLSYLTTAIVPADYEELATNPVGTGPFRFVSRTAQDSIVIERFDDYWGDKAYLDQVTFKIMESADALVLALQGGSIDLCAHLTANQAAQIGEDYEILEGTMNLVQALYLNNAVEPFDNQLVRQALCYAVDPQQIMDMIADGHGKEVGSSMYPAFTKYFVEELNDYYTYDPDKAKELLAQAGYGDGFSMTITAPSNYQPHVDTAQVIVEQLKAVGITAEIELVDWDTWVDRVYTQRQYQSTVVGVDAANMTARAMLERFTSTAGDNFINYNNPEYDQLFAQAQATGDDAEQTALYKQMETLLTETAANVYIQDMADLVAISTELEGYQFYPIYVMDLSTVRYAA